MNHLSVKKPGQRRKLKGNATGLNMIGIGKTPSVQSSPPVQCRPVLKDYLMQQHILPSPLVIQGRVFQHAFMPTAVAQGTPQRNDGMACSQIEVSPMINHVPAESAVVLSSGDEGICDGAETPSPNTLSPGSTVVAILSSPSTSNGSMEALDDVDDDIIPIPKAKARQPRKSTMKDQLGNSPVKVVPQRSKHYAKRRKPKQDDPSSPPPKKITPPPLKKISECVSHAVRLTRVGTQRREVDMPVIFTRDYIQIDEEVRVATSALTSCHWCLNRSLPSLFMRTTPAECHRLRLLLKMSRLRTQGASWYDSKGANLGERYIILIFEDDLPEFDEVVLKSIFEAIARANHVDDFTGKLTFEEANNIIMNSSKKATSDRDIFHNQFLDLVFSPTESATPAFEKAHYYKTTPGSPVSAKEASEVTYGTESPQKIPKATACQLSQPSSSQPPSPTHITDDDDSAVDLSATFTEPVRRLIAYPPPPAKQGISVTNEDLHRLDEGEFLNDVIIDFYLRYLVMSKLKEEDAKRSHMFSSFFYKRLTQTEQESTSGEKKQRHSRVKTWTRHVDLFQKDFIFVPINQSAHWFLAVICFPGLEGSQSEPEYPHQPPPSPPPPSPQDPSSDPAPSLTHHQPVDDPSTEPPLPRDPDPSPDHLQQTNENPSWSGLCVPPPQCPEESVSPLWEESENYMDQAFVLDFTASPNPMSLFFAAMKDDPFSSSDADLPDERSRAMSTSGEEDDLWSSIIDLCVTAGTSPGDQTDDGQQPHADVCHKNSEEARDVDMFSFDQDAEQDECSGKEQEDKQKDFAEVLSKPAVCRRPCILIMDSLGGHGRSDIVETLQEYLEVEWEQRKGTTRGFRHMEGSVPQVPQQDNYSDCGVYLLQYVESFFQDPLNSFQPPIDLEEWFPLKQVKSKRAEIRELILTLEQQQGHDK